jgi:hypothetical protein
MSGSPGDRQKKKNGVVILMGIIKTPLLLLLTASVSDDMEVYGRQCVVSRSWLLQYCRLEYVFQAEPERS